MSPHFYTYLENCITDPLQVYDHMQLWGHARGTYLLRTTKKSAFQIYYLSVIHRLVASTICHCEECDKVPSGDLFYMRCLTQIEVCPYLPFALAIYVFGMTLGSFPSHTICGGHWVTHLALSYEVDTSGMIPIPIRDMSTIALGKMRVLV